MKLYPHRMAAILSSVASWALLLQNVHAGTSIYNSTNRDLTLTFRKVGGLPGPLNGGAIGTQEIEVDIGQASIYYGAAEGTTIPVVKQNATLLNSVFGSDLTFLSWAVGGCVIPIGDGGDLSIPNGTLWVTSPRPAPTVLGPAYVNQGFNTLGNTGSQMYAMTTEAEQYSGSKAGGGSNTVSAVVIPAGTGLNPGYFLGQLGNYSSTFQFDVENLTPSDFGQGSTVPSRSDFYMLTPGTGGGKYLGYFELETTGALNYVAGPPAPTVSVSVANNVTTISFQTIGQATYTLYATNSAGLRAGVHTWSKPVAAVIGDGNIDSFQVPATTANQFYAVGVH